MDPRIDAYLSRAKKWREEMEKLRTLLLDCQMTEDLKWGKPCYTFQDKNVVLIVGFKDYCSLLFTKGALLKDPKGILVRAGENSQAARQLRFTGLEEIAAHESTVKAYLNEAIEVEKAGLQVNFAQSKQLVFPAEFQTVLDTNPALKTAFEALTPGRQRAYNLHFSAPKQAKTRAARVEKCVPQILDGKGLND